MSGSAKIISDEDFNDFVRGYQYNRLKEHVKKFSYSKGEVEFFVASFTDNILNYFDDGSPVFTVYRIEYFSGMYKAYRALRAKITIDLEGGFTFSGATFKPIPDFQASQVKDHLFRMHDFVNYLDPKTERAARIEGYKHLYPIIKEAFNI